MQRFGQRGGAPDAGPFEDAGRTKFTKPAKLLVRTEPANRQANRPRYAAIASVNESLASGLFGKAARLGMRVERALDTAPWRRAR